jgi:hypothetical protein
MAWPFSNVVAPNFDTGPGAVIPGAPAAIMTGDGWLIGAHFTNSAAVERVITLTDTAGAVVCKVRIPDGGEQPYEWPFRKITGAKWSADGAGCVGQVWGYQ